MEMSEWQDWLSLADASVQLGVHPSTLRRWVDAGDIPHFRTPGGHRRFRRSDLVAWMQGIQAMAAAPEPEALVQSAVGYTREEMARKDVSHEKWYTAFGQEKDRQAMRDTGRRLFGLAIQYMGCTQDLEPTLQEGRRIGEFYGQQCAAYDVSLVDTVRALSFFRESLVQAARPGQASPGQVDAEDVRIHRKLATFMDEVMYACFASYEATCRGLAQAWARQ